MSYEDATQPPNPVQGMFESANLSLVSTSGKAVMHVATGNLATPESGGVVSNLPIAVSGDQEVTLKAGKWTFQISFACDNGTASGGSLRGAPWSFSIS